MNGCKKSDDGRWMCTMGRATEHQCDHHETHDAFAPLCKHGDGNRCFNDKAQKAAERGADDERG